MKFLESTVQKLFTYPHTHMVIIGMHFFQGIVQYGFETVDTDHSGEIDFQEFEAWYKIRTGHTETTKVWKTVLSLLIS